MTSPKIQIEYRHPDSLVPYAGNARTHTPEQIIQIADSITAFGFVNPVLIGDNNVIIAGHGRLAAAQGLGLTEIPVIELKHLTPTQRRALIIADNRIAENAGWDEELLKIELEALQLENFELDILGFDPAEIDALLFDTDPDSDQADLEEEIPEAPAEPFSKLGDLWLLGKHKVLCGDSTKKEDFEKLFSGGELADMVFTDPPYNVNYGRSEETRARGKGKKIKGRDLINDNMGGSEFQEFLRALCAAALEYTKGALYICMSGSEFYNLIKAFEDSGGYVSTHIVWAKNHYTLGWSDYHKQYEPILYGWKKGTDHYWCGARDQSDIWFVSRPHLQTLHPTMKPVELVERARRNSSKTKDIVLDPFGGSGTTLIAAENLNRTARLIELDPKYVDVIVRRWQGATGKTATHAITGKPFGEN